MSDTGEKYYTLTDLILYLWRKRYVLLVLNIIGFMATWIAVLLTPPRYTATMVVASVSENASSISSSLSAIAGTSLPLASDNAKDYLPDFISLIRSQTIAHVLDQKENLRQKIFPHAWDSENHKWKDHPYSLSGYVRVPFSLLVGEVPSYTPTDTDSAGWLIKNVPLLYDTDTQQWTMQTDSTDPAFAGWLLTTLYDETEAYLRTKIRKEVGEQIKYLNGRLQDTSEHDYQEALVQLLRDREKQLTMAESGAPVAARIVRPVEVSAEPTSPVVLFYFFVGIAASFLISVVGAALYDWAKPVSQLAASAPADGIATLSRARGLVARVVRAPSRGGRS